MKEFSKNTNQKPRYKLVPICIRGTQIGTKHFCSYEAEIFYDGSSHSKQKCCIVILNITLILNIQEDLIDLKLSYNNMWQGHAHYILGREQVTNTEVSLKYVLSTHLWDLWRNQIVKCSIFQNITLNVNYTAICKGERAKLPHPLYLNTQTW